MMRHRLIPVLSLLMSVSVHAALVFEPFALIFYIFGIGCALGALYLVFRQWRGSV